MTTTLEQIRAIAAEQGLFFPCTQRLEVTSPDDNQRFILDCETGIVSNWDGRSASTASELGLQAILTQLQTPTSASQLIERIKARRDKAAYAGTTVSGVRIQTDEESQKNWIAVRAAVRDCAEMNLPFSISWSLGGNQVITLDAATATACAMAVWIHVQACYTRSAELITRVNAGEDLATIAAELNTGWPN